MPSLFYLSGEILKTGMPSDSYLYVQDTITKVDTGFSITANLPWMVPAFIGLLTLAWRVFVWYKNRKDSHKRKIDEAIKKFANM
jgi:hypothetical protein